MALALATATVPTHQIPLVDGKYHCPECDAPYDQRKGLGSHRSRAHGVKGSSPSVVSLERTRAKVESTNAEGQPKLPFAPISKKPLSKPGKPAKLNPLACDVWIGEGKARRLCGYTANSPSHLGRHKKFTHGISGTAHLSAAAKRALKDPALVVESAVESVVAPRPKRGRPHGTSGILFPCSFPGCEHRPFKTQGRLTNHIRKFHTDAKAADIVHVPTPKGHIHASINHGNFPQELDTLTRTILPEVYADTVGQIKGWLLAVAAQNDIPPQHFAARVIRDLYDTSRR